MLRKAIAFRVQRLQRAVLSAFLQQVEHQQHRERCSASEPGQRAVLGPCNRERGHEASSSADVASCGANEASNGALSGAMLPHESAAPEVAPSGDVLDTCKGSATRSMLKGAQTLHGRSQSSRQLGRSFVEQESSVKPLALGSSGEADVEQSAEQPPIAGSLPDMAVLGQSMQSDESRAECASRSAVQILPSSAPPMHEPEEIHQKNNCAEPEAHGSPSMRSCTDTVQAHASGSSSVGARELDTEDRGEAEHLCQANWDGSAAAVFKAWQEATVLQWKRRLEVSEALMQRRQWR